jgi:TetR/AcrR family transcriptional regulator, transcriptional repressor for nem operon
MPPLSNKPFFLPNFGIFVPKLGIILCLKIVKIMARPKAFDETEVLERAMSVFHKKGYFQTSMEDLVIAMGINRASMYDTYGDKHALYLKSLAFYKQKSQREQTAAVLTRNLSAREQLRAFLGMMVNEECADMDGKGCFITNATLEMLPNDDVVRQFVCKNAEDMRSVLTQIIATGQATGEIQNPESADDLAFFVQSNIAGLRVLGRTRPPRERMESAVENVMRVLQ